MARDRQRAKQRRRRQEGADAPRARKKDRLDDIAEDPALEGTTPGSHPDSGLEDVVDRQGPDGTTPTPDPLKHGSAWVDEAKLTEAGADAPGNDGVPMEVDDTASGLEDGDGDRRLDDHDDEVEVHDDDLDRGFEPERESVAARPAGQEDWGFDDDDPDDRAPDVVEGDAPMRDRRGAVTAAAGVPERRDGRSRGRFLAFLSHCIEELKRVNWPNRKQTFQGTAVTLGFVILAGGFLGLMDQIWRPLVEAIL